MDDLDEMIEILAGDYRVYVGDPYNEEDAKSTIRYNKAVDKAIQALEEVQRLRKEDEQTEADKQHIHDQIMEDFKAMNGL